MSSSFKSKPFLPIGAHVQIILSMKAINNLCFLNAAEFVLNGTTDKTFVDCREIKSDPRIKDKVISFS